MSGLESGGPAVSSRSTSDGEQKARALTKIGGSIRNYIRRNEKHNGAGSEQKRRARFRIVMVRAGRPNVQAMELNLDELHGSCESDFDGYSFSSRIVGPTAKRAAKQAIFTSVFDAKVSRFVGECGGTFVVQNNGTRVIFSGGRRESCQGGATSRTTQPQSMLPRVSEYEFVFQGGTTPIKRLVPQPNVYCFCKAFAGETDSMGITTVRTFTF